MRLSQRIEQFVVARGQTTVREIADRFGISAARCQQALHSIGSFGVDVRRDGVVAAREADCYWCEMLN
jgi:hypothetical protein